MSLTMPALFRSTKLATTEARMMPTGTPRLKVDAGTSKRDLTGLL